MATVSGQDAAPALELGGAGGGGLRCEKHCSTVAYHSASRMPYPCLDPSLGTVECTRSCGMRALAAFLQFHLGVCVSVVESQASSSSLQRTGTREV